MTRDEQYLEIYKLHSELADRVSQRREGANRLFVGLTISLLGGIAAVARFGDGGPEDNNIILAIGLVGVALSIWWSFLIAAYRDLNWSKFKVLQALEAELPFQFFTREDAVRFRWLRLTPIERAIPATFAGLFLLMVYFAYDGRF